VIEDGVRQYAGVKKAVKSIEIREIEQDEPVQGAAERDGSHLKTGVRENGARAIFKRPYCGVWQIIDLRRHCRAGPCLWRSSM
jgi:hypothetical protein